MPIEIFFNFWHALYFIRFGRANEVIKFKTIFYSGYKWMDEQNNHHNSYSESTSLNEQLWYANTTFLVCLKMHISKFKKSWSKFPTVQKLRGPFAVFKIYLASRIINKLHWSLIIYIYLIAILLLFYFCPQNTSQEGTPVSFAQTSTVLWIQFEAKKKKILIKCCNWIKHICK